MVELTAKQEMFCREYIVDFNATQAAIRAGYSEHTAKDIGCQNLAKLNISERIKELIQERNERVKVDADYVLRQAVKVHERCMQEVKPTATCDVDGNLIFEFDASNAIKSLELIGKHINIKAFDKGVDVNQKVEHKITSDSELARNLIFALQKAQENHD